MPIKKYYVYKATNLVNNKIYIGKTRNLGYRKIEHLYKAFKTKHNNYFHNAIKKYGKENFKWEILLELYDEEDAYNKEKEIIALQNKELLYNVEEGGGGKRFSNFNSQGIIDSNKKYYAIPGNKERFSIIIKEYFKDEENKIYHKNRTKEGMLENGAYEKLSKKAKERWSSEEERDNESKRKLQFYKDNPETIIKQSMIAKERYKTEKGYSNLDNARKIAVEKIKIKIIDIFTNTIYNSILEAAIDLNMDSSYLAKICKGKYPTSKYVNRFKYFN